MEAIGQEGSLVLPKGVTIDIKGNEVKVKGPKGELSRTFSPVITIEQKDGEVHCVRPSEERQIKALHAIARQHGIDLTDFLRDRFQVFRADDLLLRQASRAIDDLKARAAA